MDIEGQVARFCTKALRAHRTQQKTTRLLAGDSWRENGLVFTTRIGTLLDYANVRRAFQNVCDVANVSDLTLHGLRHTCATLLLVQGAHPKLIQTTLGHSQITPYVSAMQAEAAQLMDNAVRKRA
jgi:integrase